MKLKEYKIIDNYSKMNKRMLGYYFPGINSSDLEKGINYSINKRYKQEDAIVENDYKHRRVNMNLLELTEYIYKREPIITSYGVMFKRHGEEPNPLMDMITEFINNRKALKNTMFKSQKGSDDIEKYKQLQLLAQIK